MQQRARVPSRLCLLAALVLLALEHAAVAQPVREVTYEPRSVIRLNAHRASRMGHAPTR